ncbi:MAG: carbohydrate ABC transporter permease [Pseudonocardiaceae bacterium]
MTTVSAPQRAQRPGGPEWPRIRRRRRRPARYASMIPGLALLAGLAIYPAIYSLVISLHRWNLQDPIGRRFLGLDNYQLLLGDVRFWHSVQVTVVFVAVSVTVEFLLAFALALLFFRRFPGDSVLRSILLLPMLCAPVVVGLLARYVLDARFGIVNQLLGLIGVGPVEFLGNPSLALPALIVVDIWQWTPFLFLILLAAMQGIPEDVIDAAKIDGAGWGRIVWYQFLPLLRYPIAVGVALRVIDAFRAYDIIFMTTRGGPINATETMSWRAYDFGFRSFDIAYAAAFSWLLLVIVVATVIVVLRRSVKEMEAV